MKTLKKGWRQFVFKVAPKVFNIFVILGLIFQPVGPAGVSSIAWAIESDATAVMTADEPEEKSAPEPEAAPEEKSAPVVEEKESTPVEETEPAAAPVESVAAPEIEAAPAIEEEASETIPAPEEVAPVLEETAPAAESTETQVEGEAIPATSEEVPATAPETVPDSVERVSDIVAEESQESSSDTAVIAPVPPMSIALVEVVPAQVCLSASVSEKNDDADWDVTGEKAETKSPVELGVKYAFPLDKSVTIVFTCLPSDIALRAPLSIERIKTSELRLPEGTVAVSEYAYDITTDGMENGSFKYDLELPKIASGDFDVSYIEKSADEVKGEDLKESDVKRVDGDQVDSKDFSVKVEDLDHFTEFVLTKQLAPSALQTIAGSCMDDVTPGNLNCTANDVSIASVTGINILDDGCAFPGDTVTFSATWDVKSTASERYDVGLYFATGGQTSALNGSCSVSTLPNTPTPPWVDGDGDACGEITSAEILHPQITMTAACIDPDGDNTLNLPYCTSWDQNAGGVCNGPADAIPGAPSKCNCEDGFEIPVVVPFSAKIEVKKSLIPSQDLGQFNLSVDGTNEAVNVGDGGTTGLVVVGAGTSSNPGANHTVGETAGTATSLTDYTSSISCVDRALSTFNGGVPLTLNSTGPLTVPVDQNDDIVCTITNAVNQGTVIVNKVVINHGSSNTETHFAPYKVGTTTVALGQPTAFLPGTYTISETADSAYAATFSGDCPNGQVTVVAGQDKTCTITNEEKPAKLIVTKVVVNDAGGSLQIADFPLFVDQTGVISGAENVFDAGIYVVSETNKSGYVGAFSGDCGADGTVVLEAGQTKVCTITNDDQAASLTVVKHVVNDNGGTKVAGDFTMNVTGTDVSLGSFAGSETGTTVTLDAGAYSASEGSVAGYAMTGNDCSGTIALGEHKTCTITNNDIQPQLTVIKIVDNGNGGNLQPSDFTIHVSGNSASPASFPGSAGTLVTLNTGEYSVIEDVIDGYIPQYSADCNGSIAVGETKTCTITNDDQAPTLTLVKTVVNDNGGTKQVSDFPLFINGNPVTSGIPVVLAANTQYTASETNQTGYAAGSWGGNCAANGTITLKPGEHKTCTITNNDIQPKLTVTKVVNNDGFGTKQVSDFPLFVDGGSVTSGIQKGFDADVYVVSETNQPGYTGAISGDCDVNGSVTLAVGDVKSCTITNDDSLGRIVVKKETLPDGSQESFAFDPSWSGQNFNLSDGGSMESGVLVPGTYSVVELAKSGWDLTSAVCSDESLVSAIGLADGETVTCTFTNTQRGNIVIVKDAINNNAQDFTFHNNFGNNNPDTFLLDDDANATLLRERTFSVLPGTYAVTEDVVAGWQQEGVSCSDQSPADAISVAPGETVTCTFTNEQYASIVLVKNAVGGDGEFDFDATGTGLPADIDLTTVAGTASQTFSDLDQDNTYSITENVPANWNLTSMTCDGGNTPASITPNAGETVTCTFTNTKRGSITIEKQAVGGDGDFTFTGDVAGTLNDDEAVTLIEVVPGTYSSSEVAQTGWDLTSIVCNDGNSTGSIQTGVATFRLEAGEDVKCVFTNTKRGSITIVKQAVGDDGTFGFVSDFGVSTLTTSDGAADQKADNLVPGTYSIAEIVPAGWDLTHAVCSDESDLKEISLQAGEQVTCTFTNTKRGHIIVDKVTSPSGHAQSFSFDAEGGAYQDFSLTDAAEPYDQELVPGTYTVAEVLPLEHWQLDSVVCVYDDESVGEAIANGKQIVLGAGDRVTCTFTNTELTDVHGFKWHDLNGNGTRDCMESEENSDERQVCEFEPLLQGWTVFIDEDDNQTLDEGEQSMMTSDSDDHFGWYWFEDLVPGTYSICEMPQAGWQQTYPVQYAGEEEEIVPSCHTIVLPRGESTCNFQESLNAVATDQECNFGNQFVTPELMIEKTNDSTGPEQPGDTVTYTIRVTAPESNQSAVEDVKVTDLPPKGFGSVVALAGDLTKAYASPGEWSLGDMSPGDEISVSYQATISSDQDAGTYKDLAWAGGDSLLGTQILAAAGEDGNIADPNYVGTRVSVEVPVAPAEVVLNVRTERHVDTDTVHRVKRVLGASTLPMTGGGIGSLALAITLFLSGLGLVALSRRKHLSLSIGGRALIGVFISLACLMGAGTADAASPIVKVETPDSPVATAALKIGFVTLDIDGRALEAECHQASGPDTATVVTSYEIKDGGNSGNCEVTLPTDGTYGFFVTVFVEESSSIDSDTVTVELVSTAPSTPLDYSRSSCVVNFTAANDGLTDSVELYRSTSIAFTADSSTLVATVSATPGAAGIITDPNADCGSGYYYALRAVALSGAASGFTGDEGVTIDNEHKQKTKTTTKKVSVSSAGGAIPVVTTAGAEAAGEGQVEGASTAEKEDTDTAAKEGAVLGESTVVEEASSWMGEHPWQSAFGILIIIALIAYAYRQWQSRKEV